MWRAFRGTIRSERSRAGRDDRARTFAFQNALARNVSEQCGFVRFRLIDGLRLGMGGLARGQGCLSVDHGGEEIGLHEFVDSLEILAVGAVAAG
jgi:hypothetical protein